MGDNKDIDEAEYSLRVNCSGRTCLEGRLKKMRSKLDKSEKRRFDTNYIRYVSPGNERFGFSDRFSLEDIGFLVANEIAPEVADSYEERFDGKSIAEFAYRHIPNESVKGYAPRFDAESIFYLIMSGVGPKKSRQYEERFSAASIAHLVKAKISPKVAAGYDKGLNGPQIVVLQKLGIDANPLSKNLDVAKFMADYLRVDEDIKLLGTGSYGLVVMKDDKAFKFSLEAKREYALLKRIDRANQGLQKNVVKPKELCMTFLEEHYRDVQIGYMYKRRKRVAFEMEYIAGDSLESIMAVSTVSQDNTMEYGSDVLNGLVEMKRAGIHHHRDIRPANIMIERSTGRAVIIDLGNATTKRNADQKQNRRFGGDNDIVSLGQLMYHMVTGKHLFAGRIIKDASKLAENIKKNRYDAYADSEGLKRYVRKIKNDVPYEDLQDIIIECLGSKDRLRDLEKIRDKFRSYVTGI